MSKPCFRWQSESLESVVSFITMHSSIAEKSQCKGGRARVSSHLDFSPSLQLAKSKCPRNFKIGRSPVFYPLRYSCEFRCAAVFGPEISSSKYWILADLCGYFIKIVESYVKGVAGRPQWVSHGRSFEFVYIIDYISTTSSRL